MKFKHHVLTRLIDWETVSWSKSFRGNVPRLRKSKAVLADVRRSRSGGLRIQVKIGDYTLNTVLLLEHADAYPYMEAWFLSRRGRILGDLSDEEVAWEPRPEREREQALDDHDGREQGSTG